ncbi:Vacuolar fusion protein MON1 A [Phytophthora citrophthora]|uniref:Vacuolar fusion protein MON1 A n=1 Tax=Phytophthora citrophthora TaxID=4793 RepID=A0AAD9G3N2_9STRA|nr:Vacuolar fusion protein MON1 A [Phytophthora citrophthora]
MLVSWKLIVIGTCRGFLYAYVVFLTSDVCLLLLSSQQSPEQFPHFQAKKEFVTQRLEEIGAMEAIDSSVKNVSKWQPHSDIPLLHHFIYKNELTGECAEPELSFPFENEDFGTRLQLLNQYAKVHHLMFPPVDPKDHKSQVLGKRISSLQEATAARMVYERSDSGLFVGMCSADYRLFAWFDSLATISDAREQMQVLVDRLRHDEGLMSVALFLSSSGFPSVSALGMWP